jgi:hypothetical protein
MNRDANELDDVEQAVRRILNENRPEFSHAWKEKLSVEARLITSALADKSITEKTGDYYFFKPNKLLDTIFENHLFDEIKKLQNFGYISKMQQRHFSQCPLKIPLYGKWIRREHPFVKTVIENIDDIAEKTDLAVLAGEIEKTPPGQLIPIIHGASPSFHLLVLSQEPGHKAGKKE